MKYFAKSSTIKINDEITSELFELKEIAEHKNVRGVKGFYYKCIWESHEPTWEHDSNLKPTCEKLLSQYWRNAKCSKTEIPDKPQTTPLK